MNVLSAYMSPFGHSFDYNVDACRRRSAAFSLTYSGPTKLVGKAGKVDDLIGYAKTNADGVATYRLPGGPAGEALPGETGVGYTAGITFGNPIDGRYYCGSHASAPFR